MYEARQLSNLKCYIDSASVLHMKKNESYTNNNKIDVTQKRLWVLLKVSKPLSLIRSDRLKE